jgi:hypothetical protein
VAITLFSSESRRVRDSWEDSLWASSGT